MMKLTCCPTSFNALRSILLAPLLLICGCDVSDSNGREIDTSQEGDPTAVDYPIAFVQRPIPVDEDGAPISFDVMDQTAFNPGARLILKDRASPSAKETVITEGLFDGLEIDPETGQEISTYDVKDLEASADGKKLIFAMRAPNIEGLDDDDPEQSKWNIWEYDLDSSEPQPRRIIPLELPIKAQQGHDIAPHYLPNGRIVFSSTRQTRTRAILLDEGKTQYSGLEEERMREALLLHTMNDQGGDIKQISFNGSHDMQATVLSSGEILFLRWDAINGHDQLSLYKSDQNGQNVQLYYGFHTQNTGTNASDGVFMQPRELQDGRIVVVLQPRDSSQLGGDVVAIDANNFISNNQPTDANYGAIGPAQESLINNTIVTDAVNVSLGGYFSSAYPLNDGSGRLLVSWSQCRVINPATGNNATCSGELEAQDAEIAEPLYGLWIYNTLEGSRLPIKPPVTGFMLTDAITLSPKASFPIDLRAETTSLTDTLIAERVGVMHIRSIHDMDGVDIAPGGIDVIADPTQTPATNRAARFIRIVKNAPMPDKDIQDYDDSLFGPARKIRMGAGEAMRDIIGYVPIEPDGSAKFKVPSEVAFMLDIVDVNGRRIGGRHEIWTYLQPGEERECTGCHTSTSELPHGREDAIESSINPGATGGVVFPGTRIIDAFGTPEVAPIFEQTMAEYYSYLYGPRTPTTDIFFTDDWTDTSLATPSPDFSMRYVNINNNPRDSQCDPLDIAPLEWTAPTACTATGSWNSLCRITIRYPQNIHPLWVADRRTCDEDRNPIPEQDHTCTNCHNRVDLNELPRVPAGQLELTGETSRNGEENLDGYMTSYAELMEDDNQDVILASGDLGEEREDPTFIFQTDENGNQVPVYQLDDDGNPLLDESGAPIQDFTLGEFKSNDFNHLSTAGANASTRFFPLFEEGGIHAGYLSPDELKLISEWLDVGGQYYNTPFGIPEN